MKDPKREETPEIRSKSFRTPYTKTQPEVTFAINLNQPFLICVSPFMVFFLSILIEEYSEHFIQREICIPLDFFD